MKLLLVNPPRTDSIQSFMEHLSKFVIGHKPPLSLLYIASYVIENSSHQVKIIDCPPLHLGFKDVIKEIEDYSPDVVGITAWTDFWYSVHTLTKMIKLTVPDVFIVLGGPHINIYSSMALEYSSADAAILGDGEEPMLELLNQLEKGERHLSIHPSILMRDELGQKSPILYICKDLDVLPIPDRRLLSLNNYTSVLSNKMYITTMITSRGCPHHCVFCKMNYQKPVCRSAENVIQEFQAISDLGIQEVEVYDDTFTWSKQRVIDICKGLIDRGIKINWAVRDRISNADIECLQWMKKAGCNRIQYGIESGNDKILREIKKGITVKQVREIIAMAKAEGFIVLTYFMMGFIGETYKDVMDTINLAVELDTDYCQFSITIPYPGTTLYKDALERGIIHNDFWAEFSKNPVENFLIPQFIEGELRIKDLIKLKNLASRSFYLRPKYILREIVKTRNFYEFKRKFAMLVSLFG